MTDKAILVLSTCPDTVTARRIARALVGEGLAACVSELPGVQSTYRWQTAVEEASEVLLLIKTRAENFDALTSRVRNLHPYEVPEVIAVPVTHGHAAYLNWLHEN